MIIYILYALTFFIVAGESARTWFGKETVTSTIVKAHASGAGFAALAGLIAAPLWALAALWFSARGIISYDTEFYGDIFCFLVVFFGGLLYARTLKPITRREKKLVVIGWIFALLIVLLSCGSAVAILTADT